ncbi:MAG TPA: hypothetical protein VHA82_10915 [Ramlibacter sp.]|uniref:hypothetical protein n=1 Tax=Ramlibacter sp. TaxID=1917967 RepID=UPI002B7EBAD1|nr:hypothetical protein [Ramlibacter sp.]HVZ44310.1 hypothetical protein [Ramlibacter sp.]
MPGEQPNQPHEGHPQELPERPRLPGFDPRSVFEDAPGIRLGEGIFVVGGEWRQVLGRLAACYLKFRDADNRMYFRGVTVIAPPKAAWDHSDEDIQKAVLDGMADIDGAHLPQDVVPHFLARFLIVRGDRFDVAPVAEAVAASGERQVVLIPEASKYRDPSLQQQFGLGRTSSLLPEDVWVPHSARLGESCTAQAEPLGSVIVFHAPEDFLVKRENMDALSAVDLLYPLILGYQGQGCHLPP